ncbi:hypothetical protein ACGFJC_47280 [Nonomuraea fuscirosea]|uniref:hypothetical protein n=1 Tax=Nonomuraea fuscirosea TaxID=1291556 RepID=UPI00371D61BE
MRVIESSWQPTAVELGHLTPEHQEMIVQAIAEGTEQRASAASDEHGQEIRRLAVIEYTSPLGITRHSVVLTDPDGTETVDFDDDAAADRYYEEQVREYASTTDAPAAWDESDVENVALAPYTWTLYARVPDGDWERTRSGTSQLGARLDDTMDTEPATLEQAAEAILDHAAATQLGYNREIAISHAAGDITTLRLFDAMRIEVTGDPGHGTTTITRTEDVPLHTPTAEEIDTYRRTMDEIARQEEEYDHYAY